MLEKTEVNDKRCGLGQSMTASKTLNVKRSYNVVLLQGATSSSFQRRSLKFIVKGWEQNYEN